MKVLWASGFQSPENNVFLLYLPIPEVLCGVAVGPHTRVICPLTVQLHKCII